MKNRKSLLVAAFAVCFAVFATGCDNALGRGVSEGITNGTASAIEEFITSLVPGVIGEE